MTGKLWNTHQNDVAAGLQQTLNDLDTDYLDLYVSACNNCREDGSDNCASSYTGPFDLFLYVLYCSLTRLRH